jgi:hypothetical protein
MTYRQAAVAVLALVLLLAWAQPSDAAAQSPAAAWQQAAAAPPAGVEAVDNPFCSIFAPVCWAAETVAGAGADLAGEVGGAVASTVLSPMADGLADAAQTLLEAALTWWMSVDTVQVSHSGIAGLTDPVLWIGMLIALILLMTQAIKVILTRRGAPLLEAVVGMGKVALFTGLLSSTGLLVFDQLARASDALTAWIAQTAFGNATDIGETIAAAMLVKSAEGLMLTILLCLVTFAAGLVWLVVMFLRQAAIPMQVLLLPIAAAGQVGGGLTRQWLPRLLTSMLVVIAYKPMAMLIIAVGVKGIEAGDGVAAVVRGIVTLILAVVALPMMLKLFMPLSAAAGTSTGGGLFPLLNAGLLAAQVRGLGGRSSGIDAPVEPASASAQAAAAARAVPPAPAASAAISPSAAADTSAASTLATPPAGAMAAPGGTATAGGAVGTIAVAVIAAEAAHQMARAAAGNVSEASERA